MPELSNLPPAFSCIEKLEDCVFDRRRGRARCNVDVMAAHDEPGREHGDLDRKK